MDLTQWLAAAIFAIALLLIIFEHNLLTPKAAIALCLAFVLWLLRALTTTVDVEAEVIQAAAEVVGIFLFLFSAMLLVEVLDHYHFFDVIREWLYSKGLRDRSEFFILTIITFLMSATLDNLTTTLVMVTIAQRFFVGRSLIIVAVGIVASANAGGAWSPIGDVTTIMLWIADKFSASEVAANTIVPSVVSAVVTVLLLSGLITQQTLHNNSEDVTVCLSFSEKFVIGACLLCFGLPLIATLLDLPPFLGIMGGLGVVWLMVEQLKRRTDRQTHLDADIDDMLRRVEYAALAFFAGIILSVEALNALGVLEQSAQLLLGKAPNETRIVIGMVSLGVMSAFVDNIPLTALAIDAIPTTNGGLWSLLAFTVGTGGSLLVTGSAAGVVAMSKVKELTSVEYIKVAIIRVFIGYVAGVATWYIEQRLF